MVIGKEKLDLVRTSWLFLANLSYQFLEGYQTLIDDEETLDYDVFIIFKKTLMSLESSSQQFYNALTSSLTPDFKQVIKYTVYYIHLEWTFLKNLLGINEINDWSRSTCHRIWIEQQFAELKCRLRSLKTLPIKQKTSKQFLLNYNSYLNGILFRFFTT